MPSEFINRSSVFGTLIYLSTLRTDLINLHKLCAGGVQDLRSSLKQNWLRPGVCDLSSQIPFSLSSFLGCTHDKSIEDTGEENTGLHWRLRIHKWIQEMSLIHFLLESGKLILRTLIGTSLFSIIVSAGYIAN